MFNRIVSRTLIFTGIFLVISYRLSARQAEGDTVVVNEKVGKVIDQEECERYGLFQSVRGFQSAVLLKKPERGCVFEVIHADTVAHHDVTVQMIQTEKKVRELREYLDLPVKKPVLLDDGKRGKRFTVEMKDGTTVEGELLAVRGGRLFLKDSSASAGPEVEIDRAARVTLPKESRFFQFIGKGFLAGGMSGMLIGLASGNDEPGFLSFTAGQKALVGGLGLGILGAAAGAFIGVFTGIDESIDLGCVRPGQMNGIMEKLATWARYGKEIPPSYKTVPLPVFDKNPTEEVHAPSESNTGKPDRNFPDKVRPEKFSRFHFNYTPRYFRFQGLGQFSGVLQDLGFNDMDPTIGWFSSGPTEYPHELEDPIIFLKDFSIEFSASRRFTLGIAFESLGKHGAVGRRAIGDTETYLIGFFEGRSWFMTASYFPVPDAFATKNTVKLTACIGYGNVRMDFYGSKTSYGYESPGSNDNVTRTTLSKNASAYLLSAEWIHFFNCRWSLGLNAGYKWIPIKTETIPIDCPYSGGWDETASQIRHGAIRVTIPARTWNFGGFGIGLHFGLHL